MNLRAIHKRIKPFLTGVILAFFGWTSVFPAFAAPVSNSATGTLNGSALNLSTASVNLNTTTGGNPAVTSIDAEIYPNITATNHPGKIFTYTLLPVISGGDTGIDQITLSAPAGYANPSVTGLSLGGSAQTPGGACPAPGAGEYCTSLSGQVITLNLGTQVTTSLSQIEITFSVDTPGTLGTSDFVANVDDTSTTGFAAQTAAPGNADGDATNLNSISVEVRGIDAVQSLISADPLQLDIDPENDGTPFSTITVTPRDASGTNLGSGLLVNISALEGTTPFGTFTPVIDNGDGTYSSQMSSSSSGLAQIAATVNGVALLSNIRIVFTAGQVLNIVKTVNKNEGVIGDVMTYQVNVQNTVNRDVTRVTLNDLIPAGFKYLNGSTLINGLPAPDPAGQQTLAFNLGTIPAWVDQNGNGLPDLNDPGSLSLSYQLVLGASVSPGEYVNQAQAVDFAPISNLSTAKVRVSADPIFDLGTLIGKVFFDQNRNGYQDDGEAGISGIMIALDNGTYVTTDANGLYHFPGVLPGERLLKINRNTLPPGTTITTEEARIIQVSRGLLSKANFGVVFDTETEHIGAQGIRGVKITPQTTQEPTQITGYLESMQLLVNGKALNLHLNEVRLGVEDFQETVEINGNQLSQPIKFSIQLDSAESVQFWRLHILDRQDKPFRLLEAKGPPPELISWDGKNNQGTLLSGGEVYAYHFEVFFKDGTLETSRRQLFGVNKTSAISLNLMGSAFTTGSSELNPKTRKILKNLSEILKKHPDEKITIEGHTDSTGDDETNNRLSKARAEAAMNYLITEEGIDPKRFILKWFGATKPVASNQLEEGREVNRRVEIKGAVTDFQEAKILNHLRSSPSIRINGVPMDLKDQDRFTLKLKQDIDQFKLELANTQGKLIETTITLPELQLKAPLSEEVLKMQHPNRRYHFLSNSKTLSGDHKLPVLLYRLVGKTAPQNTVMIDGSPVPVPKNGLFKHELPLKKGENLFTLIVSNPEQISRMVVLKVDLSDKDEKGRLLMAVKPIPQISVLLPPKDAVLSHTQLPLRGMTPPGNRVWVNGTEIPVSSNGVFSTATELDNGTNQLVIEAVDPEGYTGRIERTVEVSRSSFFLMALADGEFGQITTSGNLQAAGEEEKTSYYSKGRLAYYLKGTIQGKYLITSAFDTGKREFNTLFQDLDQKETDRFFTNIDPDKHYPVYGDDSTVVYDAQSQGKFYLALESDEIHFLIGNFQTALDDTQLASFNRTFYGGRFEYQSVSKTRYGDPDTRLVLFGADVRQAHVQNTFRATGGSLYFLSEKEIIEGSERVRLEIRDQETGLVLAKIDQVRDADYSFKYEEGRILFRRPVSSVVSNNFLIRQETLQGHPVFVIVDFEYNTQNFEKNASGGRIRQQIGEHLSVGATYIEDTAPAGDYTLEGTDAQIRLGKGTTLHGEFAQSTGENAANLISEDGGLSFSPVPVGITGDGSAYHLSFESDIFEAFGHKNRVMTQGYYQRLSPGFFSNGTLLEQGTLKYGGELHLRFSQRDALQVRYDLQEVLSTTNPVASNQVGANRVILKSLEYSHQRQAFLITSGFQEKTLQQGSGLLDIEKRLAGKIDYEVNKRLTTSLGHQQVIQGKTGYRSTLGFKLRITESIDSVAEGAHANDGDTVLFGFSARLDNRSNLYLNEKFDKKDGEEARFGTVIGGDRMLTPSLRLYGEYGEDRGEIRQNRSLWGLDQRFGQDKPIRIFLNYERSHLNSISGKTTRDSASISFKYNHPAGNRLSHRFEVRLEKGAEKRIQRLTTHYGELKILSGLTLFGKLNYSDTRNKTLDRLEARFAEAGSGIAYRPIHFDRLNLIAKYTFLIDQKPDATGPLLRIDTKVASIEGIFDLSKYLQLSEKYAVKSKEEEQVLRAKLNSKTHLWINRLNVHVTKRWDISGEYRIQF